MATKVSKNALKNKIFTKKKPTLLAVSFAMAGFSAVPLQIQAQDGFTIEEVVVTARKRSESLQDVPFSVQAFTQDDIENQGIDSFEDYALLTPSLTYLTTGPGSNILYMRGSSDGGDGNPFTSHPTTALYFDEQPVSNIGRSADLHVYDIERIEVLNGPQGTLYGASSMAGTVKIVTNKPDLEAFEAGLDFNIADTKSGEMSNTVEGFVNLPVSEQMAIRLVGWRKDDGGYVDNIAATKTIAATGVTIDNDNVAEKNFNDSENIGFRAAVKIDLNDSWSATLSGTYQEIDAEGTWSYDPNVSDLQASRYNPDTYDDRIYQASLVVDGELGDVADIVYAGSYFNRKISDFSDYTGYLDFYGTAAYYAYDSTAYAYVDPRLEFSDRSKWKRQTHELRISSQAGDSRLHWLVGLFYDKTKHDLDYLYQIDNLNEGWVSYITWTPIPTPPQENVWWSSTNHREDEQIAVFGELSYDISDTLTATVGARVFKNDFSIDLIHGYGGASVTNGNTGDESDVVFKTNLSWHATEDILLWATFSQGYRAGGPNRDPGAFQGYPDVFESDTLDSYELGMKASFLDGRLRLNGALYFMDWANTQVSLFNFSQSSLGWADNVKEGIEIKGLEFDALAYLSEGLTLSGGLSLVESQLQGDLVDDPFGAPIGVKGDDMPLVPTLKFSTTLRYEFQVSDTIEGYGQFSVSHVDSVYNTFDANFRSKQGAYEVGSVALGANMGDWRAELYVNNLWDERADIFINPFNFDSRVETNRPRTIGFKLKKSFN
jgi:iron complex outermembrane recepter protein